MPCHTRRIDCELAGRAFFINSGEGPDTRIEGLTLTNASATSLGYAVRCVGTSPTFDGCVLVNNLEGAVRADVGSSPTFIDCRFEGNANAAEGGGAINQSGGTLTLTRCDFDENEAIETEDVTFGRGGAVHVIAEASLVATDCTFTNNTSAAQGGAIYTTDCIDVTFSGCLFQGNDAGEQGGGAYVRADSATVLETIFDSNTVVAEVFLPAGFSLGGGGGLYLWVGTTTVVRDCSFTGNRVFAQVVWGYAMQVVSSTGTTVSVVGCSFVENVAEVAPGFDFGSYGAVRSSTPIEFVSCSFLGNGPGRAVFSQGASAVYGSDRVTMVNCLLVDESLSDAVVACVQASSLVNCTILTDDLAAVSPFISLTVTNSILRSTGASVMNDFVSGTLDASYSNLTGGTGPGVIDVDPTFVDAANGEVVGFADLTTLLNAWGPCS